MPSGTTSKAVQSMGPPLLLRSWASAMTQVNLPVSGPKALTFPSDQPLTSVAPEAVIAMARHSRLGTRILTNSDLLRASHTRISSTAHVAKTLEE